MNENIKLILSLSLSGSILAGILFAVKPLVKDRFSKSVQYYIWLVVLLRLIIPFSYDASIMNKVFYSDNTYKISAGGVENNAAPANGKNNAVSPVNINTSGNDIGISSSKSEIIPIKDFILNNIQYIWLLGVMIALLINVTGYIRFAFNLKVSNKPAADKENALLTELSGGRKNIALVRNEYAATPMLIGVIRPCIVIPDIDFSEIQLKNILLHELTHLRRLDVPIKWLTVAAVSIHWFNPLMYFIKREINHACELSCDEGVIKNMSDSDKQDYGETLLSVVAEHRYPMGAVSTTMCEEKKTLKERLISIMKHNKKSKLITAISVILLIGAVTSAVVLGAGVGTDMKTPPNIYVSSEFEKTIDAIKGGYNWTNGNEHILADSEHPKNFDYKEGNIITVGAKEQIILSTQKINADKKYSFTLGNIEIYKNGELINDKSQEPSYINNNLYLLSPNEEGEYIYCLTLNYKDKGFCQYGFVLKVGQAKYDAGDIVTLLTIIMSSPQASSNPFDYISAHKSEYDGIVNMGDNALPYLTDIIKNGDRGLRGNIAVQICRDIEEKINSSGSKSAKTEKLLKELNSAMDKWNNIK